VLADFGLAFYPLFSEDCPLSDNPADYLRKSDKNSKVSDTRFAPVRKPRKFTLN
jgi:hypothetical protein